MATSCKKTYPFTWTPLSDEEHEERKKYYTHPATFNTNMVRSEPMNMYMPAKFPEMAERIWHFKPRPDDVWIITYPKCGTTLTQELMWQVAHGVNLDSEESQKNIFLRVPFLEFTALQTSVMPVPSLETDDPMNMMARMMNDTVAWTEKAAGPRIIKTHLPMCMLPPDLCDISKVIYVGRNVMDTCVSFYHMEKLLHNQGLDQNADFTEYSKNLYQPGKVLFGSYWSHLKDGLQYKDNPNFKFLWFEDMRSDLDSVIREIATFTKYKVTDDQVERLKEHCHIDNFKKNDAVNMKPPKGAVPDEVRENFNFIRKGIVGDWKNYFTNEENLKLWNEWITNNNGGIGEKGVIPIKYNQ